MYDDGKSMGAGVKEGGHEGSRPMQHIAWPMQHGMIFIYLISGCPWISSGGSSGSEVPTEKEKGEGGGKERE